MNNKMLPHMIEVVRSIGSPRNVGVLALCRKQNKVGKLGNHEKSDLQCRSHSSNQQCRNEEIGKLSAPDFVKNFGDSKKFTVHGNTLGNWYMDNGIQNCLQKTDAVS